MYFVIAGLALAALGFFVDVYVTGNKGSATASALLFIAAICLMLYWLADSVQTAMSMIFAVIFTLGLTLLVVLWKFADARAVIHSARTKTKPEQ